MLRFLQGRGTWVVVFGLGWGGAGLLRCRSAVINDEMTRLRARMLPKNPNSHTCTHLHTHSIQQAKRELMERQRAMAEFNAEIETTPVFQVR